MANASPGAMPGQASLSGLDATAPPFRLDVVEGACGKPSGYTLFLAIFPRPRMRIASPHRPSRGRTAHPAWLGRHTVAGSAQRRQRRGRRTAAATAGASAPAGWAPPEPSRTPHMTLLYDSQAIAEVRIEPICWKATRFALILSLVGLGHHQPKPKFLRRPAGLSG